jgi:hypothetical protein
MRLEFREVASLLRLAWCARLRVGTSASTCPTARGRRCWATARCAGPPRYPTVRRIVPAQLLHPGRFSVQKGFLFHSGFERIQARYRLS